VKNHARHWTRKIFNKSRRRAQLVATTAADGHDVGQVPIDMLPDDALLEIFGFYVHETKGTNRWMTLVHVCQRWRIIVFDSPRHLDLQLVCTNITPVRRTLNVWPPLPIVIDQYFKSTQDIDNILAALEPSDRIREITLWHIPSAQWEKVLPAMEVQFPALTHLQLASSETPLVATDLILGGSVPRLRALTLDGVSFRGLPKLLFSATDLVALDLMRTPHSAYVSPEMMVTCLSTLTRLKFLYLGFKSPQSRPHQQRQRHPLPTRAVLPALSSFLFRGVSEYLEDLVSRIDAPQLGQVHISFFHQLIFDTPQLTQFIRRIPTVKAHDQAQARLVFSERLVYVIFKRTHSEVFRLGILCGQSDWQLSSLAQICVSSFPQALIPTVEHLYIVEDSRHRPHWQDDFENSQWLEILHPFTAVKNLYLSKDLASGVARSLQDLVRGRVTESLPALQNLFLEELHASGPVAEAIGRFVAARQSSDHPIVISPWKKDGPSQFVFGSPEVYSLPVFYG
jgi:hypothetical protein